jgi:exopolysaccharide biosynthesis polyprenyl glycosylphosphotransferase
MILNRALPERTSPACIGSQYASLTLWQRIRKRAFDLIISIPVIVILIPFLIIVAAVIAAESPGPILFRQRRGGLNGREFYIYKFRTMHVLEDGLYIRQASKNDPRITLLGRILRKYSVDELPQLFNVLQGEMSLVGPRPHAVAHDREYGPLIPRYRERLSVKPGITGWAQVNGWRGATPDVHLMIRRVEHDLWYIQHWSLILDFKIICLTCLGLPMCKNAS